MEGELLRGEGIREENDSPRKPHLTKRKRAQDIFNNGEKRATPSFVLFLAKNTLGTPFCIIYAGKKLGSAVERNRVKRIFREAIRHCSEMFKGYNLAIIPRKESKKLNSRQLAGYLEEALFHLNLLK